VRPGAMKPLNRGILLLTVLNSLPRTRAERAFHLGGAGTPASASSPERAESPLREGCSSFWFSIG
jgi:hypothetical protein